MRSGRLTDEFRTRTKHFAASIIRLYVNLPRGREEVQVCAKQLLRSGTSVAAHCREASRARSEAEFVSKLGGGAQEADEPERSGDRHPIGCPKGEERIKVRCGLNSCVRNAGLTLK